MVTTRPPKTIVEPTALGTVANTDSKLLIYRLFQKGRVLAQDGIDLVSTSARTTNALENLNREFRRRTKTQASFSSEESAVALLFGLIASGQIQLRRIDGYQRLSEVLEHAEVAA